MTTVELPTPPGTARFRRANRTARWFNALAIAFCAACALVALTVLFLIIGFILYKGVGGLSLNLFTKLPGPVDAPIGAALESRNLGF